MKKTTHDRPLYRVTFSRITGQDREGQDLLSRPKEIGAVWPRKNGKAGGILSLDLIPVELAQRARDLARIRGASSRLPFLDQSPG